MFFFRFFREDEDERMLAGLSVVVSRWSSLGGEYFVTSVKNKQFTETLRAGFQGLTFHEQPGSTAPAWKVNPATN